MLSNQVLIEEFSPLFLTVDRLGPFQERMEEFDFTDSRDEPCTFYLMASKNGRGKTTVMEILATMMGMLGKEELPSFGYEPFDQEDGRAQWDVRVTLNEGGRRETVVLSLIAGVIGEEVALKPWGESDLATMGAIRWHRFGFRRNPYRRFGMIGRHDEWVLDFNAFISAAMGARLGAFEDDALALPTLIYFSAYRNIIPLSDAERAIVAPRDWNYRPVHVFDIEGRDWRDSLDNLLVWLKWLDDGRFEKAVEIVNKRVFGETSEKKLKGVRKEPPEAIVENGNSEHGLNRLSSGEKSLVQLWLRIGAHMTRNTILLIDEPEVHLHRNWVYETLFNLTQLAKDHFPSVTIIIATHSERMMKAFGFEFEEENLRKGGYIIETPEEEEKARLVGEEGKRLYKEWEEKNRGCSEEA